MSPTPPAPAGDRPTVFISYSHKDPEWVEALRTMMAPRKALVRLREARLFLEGKASEALDAHPLVRAYFQEELEKGGPEAWREGNLRLYEHLKASAPDLPETLKEMEPLFTAVLHGCRKIVEETGYGPREREVGWLEGRVAGT